MVLDKQKKELMIIAGGALVLILIVTGNVKTKKKAPAKAATPSVDTVTATAPSLAPKTVSVEDSASPKIKVLAPPDERVIKDQLARLESNLPLRDPFYPLQDKITSKRGSLALKGISWKGNASSFAIINQDIVRVGDTVGDSKVVFIEKSRVTLEKDGQKYILILEE